MATGLTDSAPTGGDVERAFQIQGSVLANVTVHPRLCRLGHLLGKINLKCNIFIQWHFRSRAVFFQMLQCTQKLDSLDISWP